MNAAFLVVVALHLVEITGTGGNTIEVNPELVTSVRDAHRQDGFPPNVRCMIFTVDGKILGARESCDIVKQRLQRP